MCQAKSVGVKGAEVSKTGMTAPARGRDRRDTVKLSPTINFPPLRICSCCSLCPIHPAIDLSPISAILDTRLQLGKLRPQPGQSHCPSPGSPYLSNGPTVLHPETCTSSFALCCAQSCPTPCNPRDCSSPGSSVHGTLQTRILEWVAISSSRGSSRPRDRTLVSCSSCTAGRLFTHLGDPFPPPAFP